jgi:hypothetical protein
LRGSRTIQSNRDAFRQHEAIGAYKDWHLAERVDPQKLLIVLLVVFLRVYDIQLETVRFSDGQDGGCTGVRLRKRVSPGVAA